jgi:hypothetical protein
MLSAVIDAAAGNDDAAGVGARGRRYRRIDGHHDALQLRPGRETGLRQPGAPPQAVQPLLDNLAFQLLLRNQRAAVAALHLSHERRRQLGGVVGGTRAAEHGCLVIPDGLQKLAGARRGGHHHLRPGSEPQRELQDVPGPLRPAPLGELVAPGGIELRSAQALRVISGKHLRNGTVGPDELVSRDIELRPLARRMHAEQAGHAFHHHAAHLGDGLADQRDAAARGRRQGRVTLHLRADPFGAGTRLARTAAAQHQPGAPGALRAGRERWELVVARPHQPIELEPCAVLRAKPGGCTDALISERG